MHRLIPATLLFVGLLPPLYGQETASWRDPSPHSVQFVTVDENVSLELLDWGGSGRPVVLLAGGGNTAHVFDEFAPKLTADFRVYGVTRRGFGASGFAATASGADRVGEDVLAVLDAIKLDRPVLVGHSIAGAELSWVANFHPDRIAGVVYLDAGYPYAFDNGRGAEMEEFLSLSGLQPPTPGAAHLASFSALQMWEQRQYGFRMPEAEFRQTWDSTADGRPARPRNFPGSSLFMQIMTANRKYGDIPAPALVVFAIPHVPETWITESSEPTVQSAAEVYFAQADSIAEKQAEAFETGVSTARVVRLRGMHYVFLSNEREVLREMRAFVTDLE
jgi:pimeloyl-ACP methyl ester carboxylesterase